MPPTLRRLLTPQWILLTLVLVVGVVVFCVLGYWQWLRYQQDGSPQNLAYTFQWPVFAAFGIYMWWRMLRESVEGPPAEEPEEPVVPPEELAAAAERQSPDSVEDPTLAAELLIARVGRRPAADRRTPETDEAPADAPVDGELAAYNEYLGTLSGRKGQA